MSTEIYFAGKKMTVNEYRVYVLGWPPLEDDFLGEAELGNYEEEDQNDQL